MYIAMHKIRTRSAGQDAESDLAAARGVARLGATSRQADGRAWPRNLPVP
jgi:hypothetical protein